jgi:hypothetical protein
MVSSHVRPGRWDVLPHGALIIGLLVFAGCRGHDAPAVHGGTPEERAAYAVRDGYTSPDVMPSAAWTWVAPDSTVYVIVDVESAIEGVVQAVADLWSVTDDAAPVRVARSQLMPSVASMRAFAFEDVTGDGVPDFLGAVADSSEEEYPVFLPGARANLVDELELTGTGYHFDTGEANPPALYRGPDGRPCAVQLWATDPVPDSQPEGWRYLALLRGGQLARPAASPPDCGP